MRTANLGPIGRNALRVVPFLSLIFTVNFTSVMFHHCRHSRQCDTRFGFQALTLYWATSNVISLGQSVILRQPAVRRALRLPAPPPLIAPKSTVKKSKGLAGFRESKSDVTHTQVTR